MSGRRHQCSHYSGNQANHYTQTVVCVAKNIPHGYSFALSNEIDQCKDDKLIADIGVKWAIEQCKDLMSKGAPVLHFYTMGKSTQTKKICEAIF